MAGTTKRGAGKKSSTGANAKSKTAGGSRRKNNNAMSTNADNQSSDEEPGRQLVTKQPTRAELQHDMEDVVSKYRDTVILELHPDGSAEKARYYLLQAMMYANSSVSIWSGLVQWLEEKDNHSALIKLLSEIYPGSGNDLSRKDALSMLQSGLVYESVKHMGSILGQSSTIQAATSRYLNVQARVSERMTLKTSIALDSFVSMQSDCALFQGPQYVFEELHKTNTDIVTELATPPPEYSDTYLHHFGTESALIVLYGYNKAGAKLAEVPPHRSDPLWRLLAFVECDSILSQLRRAKRGKDRVTARKGATRMSNPYDIRLNMKHVKTAMGLADERLAIIQSSRIVTPPLTNGLTRYLAEESLLISADIGSRYNKASKRTLDQDCEEEEELQLLGGGPDGDDPDSGYNSSADNTTGIVSSTRKKLAAKKTTEGGLTPPQMESLWQIFPSRDTKTTTRYTHLSPSFDVLYTKATRKADVDVELLSNHLALLAISHLYNKTGLPFDLWLKCGPDNRQRIGLYKVPTIMNKTRSRMTVHVWTKPEEKAGIKKKLEKDGKHVMIAGACIIGFEEMFSRDFVDADMLMSNSHNWDYVLSGAKDAVVRAYVDMDHAGHDLQVQHKIAVMDATGQNIPVKERFPRMSIGDGAVVLAQKAETNELARMEMTREWHDLVTLVSNEYKRLICFQEIETDMGSWVDLYDCGLNCAALREKLEDSPVRLAIELDYIACATGESTSTHTLELLGLSTSDEAAAVVKLGVDIWSRGFDDSGGKREGEAIVDKGSAHAYGILNLAARKVRTLHPVYTPGKRSIIRAGIDKALNAVYGPHSDRCTTINADSENRNLQLFGHPFLAVLPTAHDMDVLTWCRGFTNSNCSAQVCHGQSDKTTKVACTQVDTHENHGHYQSKKAQSQGKHWSGKVPQVDLQKQKPLELSACLPKDFIEKYLPAYNMPGAEIWNAPCRLVSTLRPILRGGLDVGAYLLGLEKSPKNMWAPSRNYNRANVTNPFIQSTVREVAPPRVDWHGTIMSSAGLREELGKAAALSSQRDGVVENPADTDLATEFMFDKSNTAVDQSLYPREENMAHDKWTLLHRKEVDVDMFNLPEECRPPDGKNKGICLPIQMIRIEQQSWQLGMNRATTELCVLANKRIQLRQDDGTISAFGPLMFHDGRGLPIPMGVVVDRGDLGNLTTCNRSSDILDMLTLSTILLTQVYKQILPKRTDMAMMFAFLHNIYAASHKMKFRWDDKYHGPPPMFLDKTEADIPGLLQRLQVLVMSGDKEDNEEMGSEDGEDDTDGMEEEIDIRDGGEEGESGKERFLRIMKRENALDFHELAEVEDLATRHGEGYNKEGPVTPGSIKLYDVLHKIDMIRSQSKVEQQMDRDEVLCVSVAMCIMIEDGAITVDNDYKLKAIWRIVRNQASVVVAAYKARLLSTLRFQKMFAGLSEAEQLLYEVYMLQQRYPMQLCGSAGSAVEEGEKAIGTQSSQEDAAIRTAAGQSMTHSAVNKGIAVSRELRNVVTVFGNLHNWTRPKRTWDCMASIKTSFADENLENKFINIGHVYIGAPVRDTYTFAEVFENFCNLEGFEEANRKNMSFLYAGVLGYDTPPAFQYATQVKMSMDWHHSVAEVKGSPYVTVPVNFHGVGPSIESDALLTRPLLDFCEPLFSAVSRRSGTNQLSGAVCSDISKTIRHAFGGEDGLAMLLEGMGSLTEEELQSLADKEEKKVTKEIKRTKLYSFPRTMPGITKNFMAAASFRAEPKLCTIAPTKNLPPGSHIPLPLVSLGAEKIAHALREKPMPCSMREVDVAPCNCRHNHCLLIRARHGSGKDSPFQPKFIRFNTLYYPSERILELKSREDQHFYNEFAKWIPKQGGFLPNVFESPICKSKEEVDAVCLTLADMFFQNISHRITGNVPLMFGYPEFKRKVSTATVAPSTTNGTLPTRSEAGVFNHYCKAWCLSDDKVKPSTFVSDQHFAQVPRSLRDGKRALDNQGEFLVGLAETSLNDGEEAYGMMVLHKYLVECFETNKDDKFFLNPDKLDRDELVLLIASILSHFCVDFSEESSKFAGSQVVADIESTIPGIAGPITDKGEGVHPGWGGRYGLSRFDVAKPGFANQLAGVFKETLEERLFQADNAVIELALQGYASLWISPEDMKKNLPKTIVNIRTGEPYNTKHTEHEGCKAGTGTAQTHTSRTGAKQRVQTKVCTHPVPGTEEQRMFLQHDLPLFSVIRAAVHALGSDRIIGTHPEQMHYFRPCWYPDEGEKDPPLFDEEWYTWQQEQARSAAQATDAIDREPLLLSTTKKRDVEPSDTEEPANKRKKVPF